MSWSYTVRNRRRWASQETVREQQAHRCVAELEGLGVELGKLGIEGASLIEVSIPYTREQEGWEARVFPWEYVLSAATRGLRSGPLTVVRHLRRPALPVATAGGTAGAAAVIVESAPGALRQAYSFESERRLVESNLGLSCVPLIDPTRERLRQAIAANQPAVVHLSGIDVHQAASLMSLPPAPDHGDGFLLSDENGAPDVVSALDLAALVTAAPRKPLLFACNAYHTAARISALAVAEGCQAAIGFQDEFDDGLAEMFFTSFYAAWSRLEHDPLPAFRWAWNDLRARRRDLKGTGIVLWTARSVLDRPAPARAASGAERAQESPSEVREGNARDLMDVEARPCPSLNYSLLHNNRDLFQTFRIRKPKPGRIRGVEIEVILHVGNETFPYRATVDLLEPVTEIRERIRVPLTSALSRSLRESVHTVVYASVCWNGQTVYRNTERVTLLPPDEWQDDDENRIWLPSFVLPRDPAVLEIVDSAERYLKALRDDRTASFDGYQSIAPGAQDPSEAVDLQVQALWASLSFERRLGYINPPPT
ncbi:MAG TPA: CHAT domain-containing protein, partial [Vicinamibacteria bacterium]|nr:CHAT domain-containing protein [Vicinamibacteria bacterium]